MKIRNINYFISNIFYFNGLHCSFFPWKVVLAHDLTTNRAYEAQLRMSNPNKGDQNMKNPFAKKTTEEPEVSKKASESDPLSVEDLLVDGTMKATITSDGRLISKKDAVQDKEKGIDLLKQREWGSN